MPLNPSQLTNQPTNHPLLSRDHSTVFARWCTSYTPSNTQFLRPTQSQTASPLVQPFLHSLVALSCVRHTDRHTYDISSSNTSHLALVLAMRAKHYNLWNSLPSALTPSPSPQEPLFPAAGLPTHLAPSSCTSNSASADHCERLQITFAYLLTD